MVAELGPPLGEALAGKTMLPEEFHVLELMALPVAALSVELAELEAAGLVVAVIPSSELEACLLPAELLRPRPTSELGGTEVLPLMRDWALQAMCC